MSEEAKLKALTSRWSDAAAAERANYQLYLTELCEAIGVERPRPAGTGYQFEIPISVVRQDGTTTTQFADLANEGHFILEAKDEEAGRSTDLLLRRAFGQAAQYAAFMPGGHPPYLMVLDVGTTLIVWDRWSGSYGGFQAGHRIDLPTLHERPEDVALLRDIWTDPFTRDPRATATAVTREIATHLAKLAASLEKRGHDQESVARFLMRCVFTMFAEDVGLLQNEPFRGALELGMTDLDEFAEALRELWRAMDGGKRFGLKRLLRFNGRFFADASVIPLDRGDLAVLMEAARADWRHVEPTIFGTLLTRALDPEERHRLGAEYTPREFIERVVRPTIEEPIRERWMLIQAEVLQLRESGKKKDRTAALRRLREFHEWLRSLQVLDPACGSGNFLYVALAVMKGVELEVVREIEALTGHPELAVEEIDPSQFHGIEVKAWAREIAELTLWIGHHQWWRRTHGHTQPPEPVLRDTGTLECGDAVLAWDDVIVNRERSRPDPTARIPHPVTGKLAPDPQSRIPYLEHRNARPAGWPIADFIVGNPPYMGNRRMRAAFGDGYVDALRAAYEAVPNNADYVMYWWHRAADEVASGRTIRAGLITTNSIVQKANRAVVASAQEGGVAIAWAIADHPWVDETGSASVRVAITVLAQEASSATLVVVDASGSPVREISTESLNADLTAHADVASASGVSLLANRGIAGRGMILRGAGFVLEPSEAGRLREMDPTHGEVIRPWLMGTDLTDRPRGLHVIDFGSMGREEAERFPVLFDVVRDRVQPERAGKREETAREFWWRFWRTRDELRSAIAGLRRYILTPYVSKHRFVTFMPGDAVPDDTLVGIGLDDAFHLGVLSSSVHDVWARAAGGRMGVGNDPRYNAGCFDAFPFPDPSDDLRDRVRAVAEALDEHRHAALARSETTTLTAMYNVVEKLRNGEVVTAEERQIHVVGACGLLRDLHDKLDHLVAETYGWPWPLERDEVLERLVALHEARVAEEQQGAVRWIRPEYQVPRFGGKAGAVAEELTPEQMAQKSDAVAVLQWPEDVLEQLGALREIVSTEPCTAEEAAQRFRGARRADITGHLDALAVLGAVQKLPDGRYSPAQPVLVTSGSS